MNFFEEEFQYDGCNPCPICGKQPYVIRDFNSEKAMFGAWCVIQCKPFFRKSHLRVLSGKASWKRAFDEAIKTWNEKSDEIRKENEHER